MDVVGIHRTICVGLSVFSLYYCRLHDTQQCILHEAVEITLWWPLRRAFVFDKWLCFRVMVMCGKAVLLNMVIAGLPSLSHFPLLPVHPACSWRPYGYSEGSCLRWLPASHYSPANVTAGEDDGRESGAGVPTDCQTGGWLARQQACSARLSSGTGGTVHSAVQQYCSGEQQGL